jgi:hypothetical protein
MEDTKNEVSQQSQLMVHVAAEVRRGLKAFAKDMVQSLQKSTDAIEEQSLEFFSSMQASEKHWSRNWI